MLSTSCSSWSDKSAFHVCGDNQLVIRFLLLNFSYNKERILRILLERLIHHRNREFWFRIITLSLGELIPTIERHGVPSRRSKC